MSKVQGMTDNGEDFGRKLMEKYCQNKNILEIRKAGEKRL